MTVFSRIWRDAAFAAAAGLALAATAFAQTATPARLQAVTVEDSRDGARIALQIAGAARPQVFMLTGPDRLVVDLPAVTLAESPRLTDRAGLVARIRHGAIAQGGVRIVLDLAARAEISAPLSAAPRQSGQFNIALRRLGSTPQPQTAASVARPAPVVARKARASAPAAAPVAAQTTPATQSRVIVIDAGHGGRDPGAIGRHLGVQEKAVTLKAAQLLADQLRQLGDYTVVLTRDRDRFLELEDRVALARDRQADLFISLHADSNPNPRARGASVYTLSERGARRARREMDRHDWEIDLGEESRPAIVEQILVDLTQRETKNRSADFAQVLITRLGAVAPLLRNTHRDAGFFVLLAPDVPAVLIELGFLTNREDEARLASDRRLRSKTRAIARAVDDFFTDRSALAQR